MFAQNFHFEHLFCCPACDGEGLASDFVCCGRCVEGVCCGSPEIEAGVCRECSGRGALTPSEFLSYATIRSDRRLVARYETAALLWSSELAVSEEKGKGPASAPSL